MLAPRRIEKQDVEAAIPRAGRQQLRRRLGRWRGICRRLARRPLGRRVRPAGCPPCRYRADRRGRLRPSDRGKQPQRTRKPQQPGNGRKTGPTSRHNRRQPTQDSRLFGGSGHDGERCMRGTPPAAAPLLTHYACRPQRWQVYGRRGLTIDQRHPRAGLPADVSRARANQAVVGLLLDDVSAPARHAADHKQWGV